MSHTITHPRYYEFTPQAIDNTNALYTCTEHPNITIKVPRHIHDQHPQKKFRIFVNLTWPPELNEEELVKAAADHFINNQPTDPIDPIDGAA